MDRGVKERGVRKRGRKRWSLVFDGKGGWRIQKGFWDEEK